MKLNNRADGFGIDKRKAMTHIDLVKKVADLGGVSMNKALLMVDGLFDALATELRANGQVNIKDVGKLIRVFRPARPGRNPKTGESVLIPERQGVKFKKSKNLVL